MKSKYANSRKFEVCALTNELLVLPVLSDYLGRLYNRVAVMEFLVAKKTAPETVADKLDEFRFISSMKDFVELKLTLDKNSKDSTYMCPITNKVVGSEESLRKGYGFFYFAECGCVLCDEVLKNGIVKLEYDEDDKYRYGEAKEKSEKAEDANLCPNCNSKVSPYNIIYLNPALDSKHYTSQKQRKAHLDEIGVYHNLEKKKRKKERKDPAVSKKRKTG